MRVVIIDCGAGNLHSVRKAFESQLPEGATLEVTTDAAALATASHIVLPGVGAFADCMNGLNALHGMRDALEKYVRNGRTPFLGICVGMQMLFTSGHEHGAHAGLGWFEGEVMPITPADPTLKIPHMGWNRLRLRRGVVPSPLGGEEFSVHPTFNGIAEGDYVYFVHSFAAQHANPAEILGVVDYGGDIVALIGRDNIVGTQFHPEKSQRVGLQMLQNFLNMRA